MKRTYRSWIVVVLVLAAYQSAFAQGNKPNVVILATGGTIAGQRRRVRNQPINRAQSQSTQWWLPSRASAI